MTAAHDSAISDYCPSESIRPASIVTCRSPPASDEITAKRLQIGTTANNRDRPRVSHHWSTLDWPALVGSSNCVKKNTGGYFFRNLGWQNVIHAARAFHLGSSLVNSRLKLVSQISRQSQTGLAIGSD